MAHWVGVKGMEWVLQNKKGTETPQTPETSGECGQEVAVGYGILGAVPALFHGWSYWISTYYF